MRLTAALFAVVCLVAIGLKTADDTGTQVATYANQFLSQLDDDQKSKAVMDYDSDKRVDWHFIPKDTRKGLALRDMNEAQRVDALRLLRSALSEAGYSKASRIMLMEGLLREIEGDDRRWERDPQKYFVTIFGTPGEKGPWGLSFEGHHLSMNFSFEGGAMVDSTPQFFAANPATVMNEVPELSGKLLPGKGTRILKDEEQLAFDLINSLEGETKEAAIINQDAPAEIRFAGEPQAKVGEPEGVAYAALGDDAKATLKKLVMTYVNVVAGPIASERESIIEEDGWDNVHFAWAGPTEPGIGHYYRVRGKRFLIEFVNTQPDAAGNPANHIHCVWRDLSGDFNLASAE
ncbi:DUF3500 domain-containing protein [Roseiconus lacunae]|uniref:DUF3500 domain-containing protein n=1 Tax=Roseiconus lacunae TaxID=2605694 RepID=A0ABT7PCH4_9BACT|nr:DUF3500 domain-containing protein [Roseiconus lacunae]MCD0462403.1 DUF3500 domain-containing protein [Roseiconus lacunae]MDM4014166.1 DUF3500 domain-containing protein [Roseiconus lacunae]WRQ53462.1 DUF3500 domain-containing protein [Stieleria sp. HD01]